MAHRATDDPKLPRVHFSNLTWIALATLAIVISLFVGWAIWLPAYTIIPS